MDVEKDTAQNKVPDGRFIVKYFTILFYKIGSENGRKRKLRIM